MKDKNMKQAAKLINDTKKEVLADKLKLCTSALQRLIGLLGTKDLDAMEACWIKGCNSIHTFGMNYSIDAYFLDKSNKVVGVVQGMKPSRISPIFFKADSVVEMKSPATKKCVVGDQLVLENSL